MAVSRSTMRFTLAIFCAAVLPLCAADAGTLVQLDTPIGSMTFELYDIAKPETVANFLTYVTSGAYEGTFAHRLLPNFILQGGFAGIDEDGLFGVATNSPVPNEAGPFPEYSNVLGTISMAKVPAKDDEGNPIPGGGPDSATSQWFINLADNSSNLDNQNGGFTVFGSIVSGMDVLLAFNAFTPYTGTAAANLVVNASGVNSNFSDLPVTQMDGTSNIQLSDLVYTTWSVVPEPSALALLAVAGAGGFVLAGRRLRGRGKAAA